MTDTTRAPYSEPLRTLIPGVIALANLGDFQAAARRDALAGDRDSRTRKYVLRDRLNFQGEELAPVIEAAARDGVAEVRLVALQYFTPESAPNPAAEQHFAVLVPMLTDRSDEISSSEVMLALRSAYTRNDELLQLLFPLTEFQRPAKPIPADAIPEEQQQIKKQNNERSNEDYRTRSHALQVLWYAHQSRKVQDHLLSIFDRPELQTRSELSRAFSFCPDLEGLSQQLQQRLEGPQRVSALYGLAALKQPQLRPIFLEHLHSPAPHVAQAAVNGLAPFFQPEDAPALRQYIEHWEGKL